ncbi:superoxide dismutase family protein [Chthonobacter rhizosphaerae]|uniref:superoxide dismutase family protein n=1 Tax=Chthonobacter rhizosphaerae TaxID=2735553 RepID=UPI0015EEB7E6|nr:superoxide dismutase family protein [Chthonobacter rhizosphaerae]
MTSRAFLAAALLLAGTAASSAASGDTAAAEIKGLDGAAHGSLTFTETPHGVLVRGELTDLPAGPHGFHVHAVGQCEPPFTSAGGHFNPTDRKHGFMAEEGHHAGDLPNLHATDGNPVTVEAMLHDVSLSQGDAALLDDDGASVVIHAKADDHATDPAGDSGDRIACGVLEKGD